VNSSTVGGASLRRTAVCVLAGVGVMVLLSLLPGDWGVAHGQTIPQSPGGGGGGGSSSQAPGQTGQTPGQTGQTGATGQPPGQTGQTPGQSGQTPGQQNQQNQQSSSSSTGNQTGSVTTAVQTTDGTQVSVSATNAGPNTTIVAQVASAAEVLQVAQSLLAAITGSLGQATQALGELVTGVQQTASAVLQTMAQFLEVLAPGPVAPVTPTSQGATSGAVETARNTVVRGEIKSSTNVQLQENGRALTVVPAGQPPLQITLTLPTGVMDPVTGKMRVITVIIAAPNPSTGSAEPGVARLFALGDFLRVGTASAPAAARQQAGPAGASVAELCPPVQILESVTLDASGRQLTAQTRCTGTISLLEVARAPERADYPIGNGYYFSQANGMPTTPTSAGYLITDDGDVRLWSEFQRLGGVAALGYPAGSRTAHNGFVVQLTQKAVLQWRPERQEVWFANVFDELHEAGLDNYLFATHQIPPPLDLGDAALPACVAGDQDACFVETAQNHYRLLERPEVPGALREFYWADGDPLNHWGLPMGVHDFGNVVVVRNQRAAFQYWRVATPFAAAGSVTVVNGGDVSKQAGLWSRAASMPQFAPEPG
jgi:hypothetical protein